MKNKFFSKKNKSLDSEEREFVADQLESRLLYSAAPVEVPEGDMMEVSPVARAANFHSIDVFLDGANRAEVISHNIFELPRSYSDQSGGYEIIIDLASPNENYYVAGPPVDQASSQSRESLAVLGAAEYGTEVFGIELIDAMIADNRVLGLLEAEASFADTRQFESFSSIEEGTHQATPVTE
jgi:hypothetical protein